MHLRARRRRNRASARRPAAAPRPPARAVAASRRVSSPAGSAISRAMSTGDISGQNRWRSLQGRPPAARAIWRSSWRWRSDARAPRGGDQCRQRAGLCRPAGAERPADRATRCSGVEHRLFGAWDGADACSAADWAEPGEARDRGCPRWPGGADPGRRDRAVHPHPARRDRPGAGDRSRRCAPTVRALPAPRPMPRCIAEDPERAAVLNAGDTTARSPARSKWSARPASRWRTGSSSGSAGSATAIDLHPLVLLPPREGFTSAATRASQRCWSAARSRKSRPARARSRPAPAGDARDRRARDRRDAARRMVARGGDRARPAGDAQLRQAAIHLVPPPAAARLAAMLSQKDARSRGTF